VIYRVFPFLRWLPELRKASILRGDVIAGITVAAVLIPQSMAYARLAGLPAVFGLYAAFLPPVIAGLFGSSRQLATGPVALVALISAATVGKIAPPGSVDFVSYSVLLALMVGLFRLTLGLLRFGMLVNLLSGPVVVGFTNAAALIIASSQLPAILGVDAPPAADRHLQMVLQTVRSALTGVHWHSIGMATLTAIILLVLRFRFEKILVAVAVTTAASWFFGYQGAVVGSVPSGLPSFVLPRVDVDVASELAIGAAFITVIGLMEAMSIAKSIATKTRQQLDVNQELIGQGLSNIVGGLFQSFAVSGSFSRSAINYESGARTGFAMVVCSCVVMATLLFLTPLLYHLPQATLAVIIVFAVLSLIRVDPVLDAWRVTPKDGAIAIVTFLATLVLAPQLHFGIGIGVSLTLILYLHRSMRPHVAYLSRHPDGPLVDAEANDLALDQYIALIRFDGRLYFGDSSYFESKVLEAVTRLPELQFIVIDAGSINQIDATGERTLRDTVTNLRGVGIDIYFTRAKIQFVEVLERTGCLDHIGRDHFFDWNQHALDHLWDQMGPAKRARSPLHVPTPGGKGGIWAI
jgi:SulP family sulfate permease